MKKILLLLILFIFMFSSILLPNITANSNTKKICIDPGHQQKWNSGKEPLAPNSKIMKTKVSSGTSGVITKIPEYVFVLNVGLKLEKELKQRGYQVHMTRTKHNVNMSNVERAQYCNNVNADLTVRIHADGNNNKNISGIHLLYPSGDYTKSINLQSKKAAEIMLSELTQATGTKKAWGDGLSPRSDITGFNWAKKPVVLPELGFMSNPAEDKKLSSSSYQDKLVTGMANGIDKYFGISYKYFSVNKNIPIYKQMSGSATIGTLYKNEVYPIIKDEFINWYKVKVGNTFGYIKKADTKFVPTLNQNKLNNKRVTIRSFKANSVLYVKENITGKQITIGTIDKHMIYPIVDETNYWYQIDFLGRLGYIWKANTSLNNVYFSPTKNISIYKHMTGSTTIGTIYKNEVFPILSDEFVNWYKVKIGDSIGYIRKSDINHYTNVNLDTSIFPQNSNLIVKANSILFAKENITGKQKTLGKVNKDVSFPVINDTGNWYQIVFSGRLAYVWKSNTTVVK